MIIDTVDMLHQSRIDVFVLVTSDSDFTALATRIREEGFKVVGMGRMTAPSSFVKACDEFLTLESLFSVKPQAGLSGEVHASLGIGTAAMSVEEGKDLLARAVKQAANSDGVVRGADLGIMLKRLDPRFSPFQYGARRLSEFIALYPGVLRPTGKRSGLDPTYKIVTVEPTKNSSNTEA